MFQFLSSKLSVSLREGTDRSPATYSLHGYRLLRIPLKHTQARTRQVLIGISENCLNRTILHWRRCHLTHLITLRDHPIRLLHLALELTMGLCEMCSVLSCSSCSLIRLQIGRWLRLRCLLLLLLRLRDRPLIIHRLESLLCRTGR